MKKVLFLLIIICTTVANAQDYLISFAGAGASATVSSVKVENLTSGESLILTGSDILHLTVLTGINPVGIGQSPEMRIYPNPMTDNSILQISPPSAGNVIISVLDMSGKLIYQAPAILDKNLQEFRLSGVAAGFYMINVKGNSFQYSGRLLCNSKAQEAINIEKISSARRADGGKFKSDSKGRLATVDMNYAIGDRLKLTGISGNYSTIIMDMPLSSKTITFYFIICSDGDGNNYPVVQIGTQMWMAENLKTTKMNDASPIFNVIDNVIWDSYTSPAYCWYNNDGAAYKDLYGALYNWHAINTGKLCPTGWHAPFDNEWTALVTFLGGESNAGGKLKETGTVHWIIINTGATNESGFTALPGGTRYVGVAEFSSIGQRAAWWTATMPYTYSIWNNENSVFHGSFSNAEDGFSVRCVKDE